MSRALLNIPKSQAIALFVAMGFKTAKGWNCKKLTEKINAIEEAPDEPMETEELDELMDNLMEAEEAVVVELDKEGEEVDDDNDDDATDDDDSNTDDEAEGDDDFDDEEEEKPKKKGKNKKGKDKSAKSKGTKAVKKEKKESLDSATLALLQTKPMKIESLVNALLKKFPESDEETLTRTTKRRVSGHLQNKYGVTITKSKKGAYSVEE